MRTPQATMAIAAVAAAALTLGACNQSPTTEPQAANSGKATQPGMSLGKLADLGKSAGTGAPASDTPGMAASSSDSAIKSKVTEALSTDPTLKAADIQVDAKAGTVTLSGTVDTNEMRMHAHQIVATTPGVANVVDNLSVRNAG